ncbi:oxidoreductase [Citricoccus zhacaiensis]|uniref:Oxidoreductase n=1 Tax=Citricoccus zhacaiensis TaxID=489142 RepID=A0ABQ2MB33_9MICC|nr:aldo/keto reductase [Citricoccus zhacaiensis]GGO49043.1 oxidoreductase [Citricoccus zhacaiensis]
MNSIAPHATLTGSGVDGVDIPIVGIGTWPLTGSECTASVTQALALGYRHVDTAENYGNEDAVGLAVRESGLAREDVFVTTKFNKDSHGDAATVRQSAERALKRMGLDYLDLFLVHWPNPAQDLYVQTCESLVGLVETGLVRAWGVSNFKPVHLQRVLDAGMVPPVNQVQVDPEHAQHDVEQFNAASGVATAAYSPLARGSEVLNRAELVDPAARVGRTPAQVALRWHLQQGRIVVPRSANEERQRQNLDLFDFALTEEEMARIDALDTGEGPRLDSDEFGH